MPNLRGVLTTLNDGDPNDETIRIPNQFTGETVTSAIKYHRANARVDGDIQPSYCLVLDTLPTSASGVLLINPDYLGRIDGVRMPLEEAGISISSLSIGNTTWQECRETCNDQGLPLSPRRYFLVYDQLSKGKTSTFDAFLQSMNDGLGSLNSTVDQGFAGYRDIYSRGPKRTNIDEVMDKHRQCATEKGYCDDMFAIVDNDMENDGVLFIHLGGEDRDIMRFRKKQPEAGEILNWVHTGLFTWEEAAEL